MVGWLLGGVEDGEECGRVGEWEGEREKERGRGEKEKEKERKRDKAEGIEGNEEEEEEEEAEPSLGEAVWHVLASPSLTSICRIYAQCTRLGTLLQFRTVL